MRTLRPLAALCAALLCSGAGTASAATPTPTGTSTAPAAATVPAVPAHLGAGPSSGFRTQAWDAAQRIDAGAYLVERVRFVVQGSEVVGNLFLPRRPAQPAARAAAVVVIGPVAYVKEQAPMQYASRLAQQGLVALVFDPRHHGESQGEPRRHESGPAKVADLRAAAAYLAQRPEVDAARIHALGVCQGVNWAADATQQEPLLQSVALVAGHYLTPQTAALYLGSPEAVRARIARAHDARLAFEREGRTDYIPIVSLSDANALLTARPIHDFYYRWADRGPFAGHTGLWENRITQMSEAGIWGHDIAPSLRALRKPVLMLHSDRAASGPEIPRRLFEQIGSERKAQVWLPERNQIQFYQDPTTLDAVVAHLAPFFADGTAR
ncbi:hypothetical protein ASF43_10390 [Pseudorhodoferax sp. Leaf267]|nr:hypothetical protein ASF43_10390 [Pseudorhodoferax sp. Leaf267]